MNKYTALSLGIFTLLAPCQIALTSENCFLQGPWLKQLAIIGLYPYLLHYFPNITMYV